MKGKGALMHDRRTDRGTHERWWARSGTREVVGVMVGAVVFGLIGILIGDTITAALGFSMGGGIGYGASEQIWAAREHEPHLVGWTFGGIVAGALIGGLLGFGLTQTNLDLVPSEVMLFLGIAFGAAFGTTLGPMIGKKTR